MKFSEKLKKAMQEKDMNLTALSAATGIGKSSISQYLSGKNEPPDKKKTTIALAMGLPVLVGCAIYEDFYRTGKNGNIPTIDTSTPYLGGHLMLLVGYKPKPLSNKVKFILRNSWGESIKTEDSWGYAFNHESDLGYGDKGHGYIDEDNLMNILLDAWVIAELE